MKILEHSLLVVSLAIGFVLVELGYRTWLYWKYAVDTRFDVVVVDTDMRDRGFGRPGSLYGPYPISVNATYSRYGIDGQLDSRIVVRFNNFGWVSHFDYSRAKAPGEYRIAVVGDSLTASVNNETPWPDVLQRLLDSDLVFKNLVGARRVSVLNLGVAGAGMQLMANPLAVIAKRFSADLLVVNLVIEDLARRDNFDFEKLPIEPEEPFDDSPAKPAPRFPDSFEVNGIRVAFFCQNGSSECRVNPVFQSAPGRKVTAAEINMVKRKAARRLLWRGPLLSLRPLTLEAILGKPLFPAARAETPALAMLTGRKREDIDIGLRALRLTERLHPGSLRTLNPVLWYFDPACRPRLIDQFLTLSDEAGLPIVDMTYEVPMQLGDAERRRWYNLPFDYHWSDHGAEIYAHAVARVIKAHLANQLHPEQSVTRPCEAAFKHFKKSLVFRRTNDYDRALQAIDASITALPPDAEAHNDKSYRACEFVADLFSHAAILRGKLGRSDASAAALVCPIGKYPISGD